MDTLVECNIIFFELNDFAHDYNVMYNKVLILFGFKHFSGHCLYKKIKLLLLFLYF